MSAGGSTGEVPTLGAMSARRRSTLRRAVGPMVVAFATALAAVGWLGGASFFGFESPFWDLGLLPILAALIVGVFHLQGPRRRFLIGFEACGAIAVLAHVASCSRPARWSPVSALLPFQTGFWLAPEMKTSLKALNPGGVLLDAAILAAMPLLVALTGGWLASARITLRRSMAWVAAIAVLLGVASAYLRRARHYDEMGQSHRSQIVSVLGGSVDQGGTMHFTPTGSDRLGKPVTDAQRRRDAWHEDLAQKYWQAAHYPWITVREGRPPE